MGWILGNPGRALILGLALGLLPATPAEAQFNPGGRTKPKPGGTAGPKKPGRKKPRKPKKPSRGKLIKRYRKIVLSQPGALFPLQRLAELYRERDGNLDKLIRRFERYAKKKGKKGWNAQIALAGLYRQDAQMSRAMASYQQAIKARPKSAVARLAYGQLLEDQGQAQKAYEQYEKALSTIKVDTSREQTIRKLMGLALDLKKFSDARRHHKALVKRAKGSFYAQAELGRELMNRAEYERAVTEYRRVVKAARGDNRVLAPALRDLGRALAKTDQRKEAMKVLKRALRLAGRQSGVSREIYTIIAEIYRAEEKISELVTLLEKDRSPDFQQLVLLGSLYEETGQVKKALATYKAALKKKSRDIDTRLKVVQLLQIQGELDEAIKQYEALIRAAPRNPDYVFQLAEALIQRGDRPGALKHLKKLEGRSGRDEETLAALVDFYERVEEKARALAVLERLGKRPRDPRHLVDLGDRYYQEGDKEKAVRTWKRILSIVASKSRGHFMLGEVYLEHDLPREGLAELKKATRLAPKVAKYRKAYALGLERTGAAAGSNAAKRSQFEQALKIWQALLKEASDSSNAHLARESRTHIVTLWGLAGTLDNKISPLDRRLSTKPPDLEAGRMLGEIHIRRRRYADAERVLLLVTKAAPGDAPSFQALERSLVMQRKLREAISVLKRMIKIEPKRARVYYQRMAQYAAELYLDDEAIKYAARAVELSPDDAEGHRKLGEMYRRRQDNKRAIIQFRKAISKNDRLFTVYFQLAELLLSQGATDEADRLLRRVVRASPDEDLVSQAARMSMQVNLGKGTLESLERELLPVVLGNPQKPIYRRLLVEIYGAMAFPLVHKAKSSTKAEATKARAALRRIGERAVKPLLDALADPHSVQQRTAIELLAHIQNVSAGPALIAYATGKGDSPLRVRAMIAAGNLGDASLLPKFQAILAPGGKVQGGVADPVFITAAWAVARMKSPAARKLLHALLSSDAPNAQALAAVGLGLQHDQSAIKPLAALLGSIETGPGPRAAAVFALGELGARGEIDTVTRSLEADNLRVRGAALVALARLGSPKAKAAIAEALLSPEAGLRQAAEAAALVLATGKFRRVDEDLPAPSGGVKVEELLAQLLPGGYDNGARVKALELLAPALARAAATSSQSSPERARVVADALLSRGGVDKPGFGSLTRDYDKLSPAEQKRVEKAVKTIADAVLAPFAALARHPDVEVRLRAVGVLAGRKEMSARQAIERALGDEEPRVRGAALAALVHQPDATTLKALLAQLDGPAKKDWALRVKVTRALGAIAKRGGSSVATPVSLRLKRVVLGDSMALVREAALEALVSIDKSAARSTLRQVSTGDAEPRVRARALELLK